MGVCKHTILQGMATLSAPLSFCIWCHDLDKSVSPCHYPAASLKITLKIACQPFFFFQIHKCPRTVDCCGLEGLDTCALAAPVQCSIGGIVLIYQAPVLPLHRRKGWQHCCYASSPCLLDVAEQPCKAALATQPGAAIWLAALDCQPASPTGTMLDSF